MAHVCPWWLGYFLSSPLRRFRHKPEVILKYHVDYSMTVLDIGPGMGFFTIPMAKMVGVHGRVIAVDLQEKMIESLRKRADKEGVSNIIETRVCAEDSLGIEDLEERVNFVLAFAVVHEVPDAQSLLEQVYAVLKKGGKLLVSEPKGHVKKRDFDHNINIARQLGFEVLENPQIKGNISAILVKK